MKDQKLELYFFFIALIGILALTFFIFLPFLGALAVAAVLAVVFHPLHIWILDKIRWKGLSAGFSVALILLIVFVPLLFLGALLFDQAQGLFSELNNDSGNVDTMLGYLESQIAYFFPDFSLDADTYLRQGLSWITQSFGSIFAGTAQAVLASLIGLIALFYFLRDGEWFKNVFIVYSPLRDTYDSEILRKIKLTINAIIKGSLLVALIQGLLSGIGFTIFGVPNPALWGSVAAIGALIPGIGTTAVLIPAILYLFFFVGVIPALLLLIWGALAVGLVDNLLGPYLIGRNVHIHPLLILLSVLGGLSFFGPVGFLLGPIVLSLLLALADIYNYLMKHEKSQGGR